MLERGQAMNVPVTLLHRLWDVYGSAGHEIVARWEREQHPVIASEGGGFLGVELIRALEEEWADSLVDLFQRRLMLGLSRDFGVGAAQEGGRYLAAQGVWSEDRARQELMAYLAHAQRARGPAAGPSHVSD